MESVESKPWNGCVGTGATRDGVVDEVAAVEDSEEAVVSASEALGNASKILVKF